VIMMFRLLFTVFALFIACTSLAKRSGPEDVSPLVAGDYVYTVPHWSTENGTNQNGGYIRVLDAKTGMEDWGVQVYKTKHDHSLESDVQDVFITEMEINFWNTVLTVKDELGRKYEIDLKTKKVKAIE
jgi:hypothetical protein